ncbi:Mor transcription activator family protein [Nevskia sp.]|uniref:Mor transcription activator family protein n=1 Tax=Nevskia sp. TaxID=1929292 RepID=UPI0025D2EC9E|nr:Mor transcription activator family protein [Nevskia sp.]
MNAAPATFPIDERLLPPVTRRIVGAIGVAATVRLLKSRGGTRLWVPKQSARSEVLTDILGRDLAEQLVKAFANDVVISLPKADKMLAQVRDTAIRSEHAAGDSMAVLALRYDLTERHVLNVVQSEARPVWRQQQPGLF